MIVEAESPRQRAKRVTSTLPARAITMSANVAASTVSTLCFPSLSTPILSSLFHLYAGSLESSPDFPSSRAPNKRHAFQDYVTLVRPRQCLYCGLSIHSHYTYAIIYIFHLSIVCYENDGEKMLSTTSQVDTMQINKKNRAIKSERISVRQGWMYCNCIVNVFMCIGSHKQ